MIDLETIEREIIDLEKRDTTFATMERLAWLYIVKDHLISSARSAQTGSFSGSDFREACSNVPIDSLLDVLDEHFDTIMLLYPREYENLVVRIRNLK